MENNIYCDPNVVGIALVVEEIGKGSKLVFKYPHNAPPQPQQYYDHHEKDDITPSSSINTTNSTVKKVTNPTNAIPSTKGSKNTSISTTITGNRRIHHEKNMIHNMPNQKKDIFFRLKPSILAKLFRTKPPLCDQPVSLNIEGTIFCCRSVLLDTHDQQHHQQQQHVQQDDNMSIQSNYSKAFFPQTATISSSTSNSPNTTMNSSTNNPQSSTTNTTHSSGGLVLFSIIVAMKPTYIESRANILNQYFSSTSGGSCAISNSSSDDHYIIDGIGDDNDEDIGEHEYYLESSLQQRRQQRLSYLSFQSAVSDDQGTKQEEQEQVKEEQLQRRKSKQVEHTNYTLLDNRIHENASLHFPAVLRIHLTLSRLCKVLEREEKRCLYVSRQVSHLMKVANEGCEGGNDESGNISGGDGTTKDGSGTINGVVGTDDSTQKQQRQTKSDSSTSLNQQQQDSNESNTSAPGSNRSSFGNKKGNDSNQADSISPSLLNINGNIIEDALSMYTNQNRSTRQQNIDIQKNTNKIIDDDNEQQKKVDLMLAASPPPTCSYNDEGDMNINGEDIMKSRYKECIPIYGNLVLELTQVYQALSRNSQGLRPSPDSLLSGRDGIVYINHHVAVKVEPAKASRSNLPIGVHSTNSRFLRPYHTLLFHPIRASELLRHKISKSFQQSNDEKCRHGVDPILRQTEKLLLVADDPFKSLHDMASDAALPLQSIIESAMSLLDAGVCIALPVMTPSTRFGCSHRAVERINSLKLEFAQQFGYHLPIHLVVSALTSVCVSVKVNSRDNQHRSLITLGELIEYSKMVIRSFRHDDDAMVMNSSPNSTNKETSKRIPPIVFTLIHRIISTLRSERIPTGFTANTSRHFDMKVASANNSQIILVENAIISMTAWLRARSIIVEQKEYLASIKSRKWIDVATPHVKKLENNGNGSVSNYESFFREFVSNRYVSCGNVSTRALAWKFNKKLMFIEGFRDWGLNENLLSSATRISTHFDDWGAP